MYVLSFCSFVFHNSELTQKCLKFTKCTVGFFSDSNHQTSSTRCYDNNQSRLARQDLLRRRDINLYTGGLHPRLLHGQQPQISPRLSLFSNQNTPETQPSRTSISGPGPCRAFPASVANNTPQMPSPSSFLQSPCSPPPSYQVINYKL